MAALLPVREERRHVSLWGYCHEVPLGPPPVLLGLPFNAAQLCSEGAG